MKHLKDSIFNLRDEERPLILSLFRFPPESAGSSPIEAVSTAFRIKRVTFALGATNNFDSFKLPKKIRHDFAVSLVGHIVDEAVE